MLLQNYNNNIYTIIQNKKMDQKQQSSTPKCLHFQKLIHQNPSINNFTFIKPSIKGWLCLTDGCCRKSGQYSQIKQQLSKFQASHKIFMEMTRLEIYCYQCNTQITDQQQHAYQIRKLALQPQPQKQKQLFGSNIQYPSGFIKQKSGITGTIGNQLTSYINAGIQILAHISPFYQISQQINIQLISDKCLKQVFICINKIRSGIYRIVQIKNIQKFLIEKNKRFLKYTQKTPANFVYQILHTFSNQFQYRGKICGNKQIYQPLLLGIKQNLHLSSSSQKQQSQQHQQKQRQRQRQRQRQKQTIYSPMKQLFAGQFIWHLQCPNCNSSKIQKIQFQCLRLQIQTQLLIKGISKLQQLIQQIFNFNKLYNNIFAKYEKQCNKKQQCIKYQLNANKCYIKMPNILLLQFIAQDGMNVQYPDILDLGKYSEYKINGNKNSNSNSNKSNSNSSSNIEQQQYKYNYIGSIAKNNKKYYTHIKQTKDSQTKQYIFDDNLIKQFISDQSTKQQPQKPNKIVNAIYKLPPKKTNKFLSKNIQSSILVNIQCYIPLPDFWYWYLYDLKNIQPLINPFICQHGYLSPQIHSKTLSTSIRKIPPSIYQYLVQLYGGYSILIKKQNQYCTICRQYINNIRQLKQSQKQMAKFADQLSNKKSKVCVDLLWFEQWKKYLYEKCQQPYKNQHYKRPKQINNKNGIKSNGEINQNKYKKVSPEVWYFFKKFYGGGPLITQNLVQPSLALVQAVDLRYERVKDLIKKVTSQ